MKLASSTEETYAPEGLIVGSNPVITGSDTVAAGQSIAEYTPLGRVAASGELIESLPGAGDGSEVPIGISMHAIDTTGGAASHPLYLGGGFNADMIAWDGTWTAAQKAGAFDGTPVVILTPAVVGGS